ncbi:MAG: hypothetical protein ACRDSP_22680 [Pseudonocardiaceae bacterium]
MQTVMLELRPPVSAPVSAEVVIVEDLDELSAAGRCSCSAGDDNPY